MKHYLSVALLCLALLPSLAKPQSAPPVINYQGRLTQSTGVVVPDGLTGMRVRIFATASGGTALWDSGDLAVATKSGTFSILLGSGGMLAMSPAVFALGTVYIEVQPNGQAPLLPRQPIASVPWSLYAQTVSDGAISTQKLSNDAVTAEKLSFPFLRTVSPGAGVPAFRINTTGGAISIYGESIDNIAVQGVANGSSVYSQGVRGNHVSGNVGALGGFGFGVYGLGIVGYAGRFEGNVSITGNLTVQSPNNAIRGIEALGTQGGVHGSGPTFGVVGDGGQTGVKGSTDQDNYGTGVYGVATPTNGNARGGHFEARSPNGTALYAINTAAGTGLWAQSQPGGTAGYFSGLVYITNGELQVNGNALKPGGGSWSVLSDRRLKKNIRNIPDPLSQLLRLRGRAFEYKDPAQLHERDGRVFGFIAQEVETEFPEWVGTNDSGYKRVTIPVDFDALAVEAIREQQATIEQLKRELQVERAARLRTERDVAELRMLMRTKR